MILTGSDSIRDVIAFPKNATGHAVMENAPNEIADQQLEEYHLNLKPAVEKRS
ncbi:hypothetical protein [Mycoplasma sp. ATU-Cv-508]